MTLKGKVRERIVPVKESPRALVGLNTPEVEKWLSERIRQGMEDLLNGLLQEEVEQFVGAGRYERTGNRRGYRSGSYERQYTTRVGEVNIKMPQTKLIPFSSEVIERYRRREASVEEALIEMYLAGVSTRRVQDITEALFDSAVKPGTVSRLNQQVYEKLEAWRQRKLEVAFPYVYLDGIALKRQWAGEVKNVSVLVAAGVSEDGRREVIGISEGCKEDKEGWRRFLQDLKRRGLAQVTLVISDACVGLKEALAEVFPEADWQRCIVHFYRNVLTAVPRKKMRELALALKAIHGQENLAAARAKAAEVLKVYGKLLPGAMKILAAGLEETLTYYKYPESHWIRIRTNNAMERLLREVRRRTRVVGAFPDGKSALMLATARVRWVSERRWSDRRYLDMNLIYNEKEAVRA
jgi:transposase-like protein